MDNSVQQITNRSSVRVIWNCSVPKGEVGNVARRLAGDFTSSLATGQPMAQACSLGRNDKRLRGVWRVKHSAHRYDVRVYILSLDGALHVLYVDPAKRRTKMLKSTVELLVRRRNQIVEATRRSRTRWTEEARV